MVLWSSKMSTKLQEIRKKLANLEKEADELKRLKSDYHYAKQFRRMPVSYTHLTLPTTPYV